MYTLQEASSSGRHVEEPAENREKVYIEGIGETLLELNQFSILINLNAGDKKRGSCALHCKAPLIINVVVGTICRVMKDA